MKYDPRAFCAPSYHGDGLLNLMVSLAEACAGAVPQYAPLIGVENDDWWRARNLILMVVDGLGADLLARRATDGLLHRHQHATLTSVCPTTTAAAVPTLMSGLPPARHGLTGWHVYLDEIDAVTAVLPLTVRGGAAAGAAPIDPASLYAYGSLYGQLGRPAHVVTPARLINSAFSRISADGATVHPYYPDAHPLLGGLDFCRRRRDFFGTLRRLCHEAGPPRFIHAYWPDYDHAAHEYGSESAEALGLLATFERDLAAFIDQARGTDTLVLLTADHGFIDSPPSRQVLLDDHVALGALLARPICGERRFAYCYLNEGARADFEDYISTVFADRMDAWPREKLLDESWFGYGPVNDRLASRVGDYVLVMRDDWTIVDHVPGEAPLTMVGVHGGLSRREMRVPLCVLASA